MIQKSLASIDVIAADAHYPDGSTKFQIISTADQDILAEYSSKEERDSNLAIHLVKCYALRSNNLADLTDYHRADFFEKLCYIFRSQGFCTSCGGDDGEHCHCENDD